MPTNVTTPDPMPADGCRKLSPREMALRQRALACINGRESAQCQGQVYATLFFDGTGNNIDFKADGDSGTQKALSKHSNIARLFDAAIVDARDGFFPFYIPGVGTPFEKIDDLDGGAVAFGSVPAGGAAGYMGADRINWGITRVYNAVHRYLTGSDLMTDDVAKTVVANMSSSVNSLSFETSYRRMVLRSWEEKLSVVVKSSQRKVTQINIAVFGFSRGAAEARAFANWFTEVLERDDGAYRLAGVPSRIYFMGLFDTVASVGVPNLVSGVNGHFAWADGSMEIPSTVEQCVHYIALHEQRASFPLETAKNIKQVVYPGVHSDVGGGYLPTEQGKLSQCSQIPLVDMHHDAIKAGVPILSRDEIAQRPDLEKDFHVSFDLTRAYNNYWAQCGIGASGDTGTLVRQHTHQYAQWRGGMLAQGQDLKTRGFFHRANSKDKSEIANAQVDLAKQIASLRTRMRVASDHAAGQSGGVPLQERVDPVTRILLEELDRHDKLPNAVRSFMDDYVHDSRAGFLIRSHIEPSDITGGYLRYRNIYGNARHLAEIASAERSFAPDDGTSSGIAAELT